MTNHLHALEKVDGILWILGFLLINLTNLKEGFHFGPMLLDMRMNQHAGLSASDVINQYEEKDLVRVFREFGELKTHKVASRII